MKLSWIFLLCLTLCASAIGQSLEDRVARLEAIVIGPATQPAPDPTPATQPTRPAVNALGLVRSGTVDGKLIRTERKREIGVQVIGDGVTLRNLEFAPDGGYLCQINNSGTTVDGFEATTFFDYAIYVQGARNTTVRRMSVVGGSTNESILRLDDVKGFLLEDSFLDYRPVTTRKAVFRGFGTGIIVNRTTFYGGGASVGLTAMTGFDGGEGYIAGGMLRITQAPWIVTVENRGEWESMVRAVVAVGIEDPEAILREVLKRVPVNVKLNGQIVTLDPSRVDVGYTARERVRYLAQRAESTFSNCKFFDAPIRNSAGGTQRYFDCTFSASGDLFHGWNEPTYPNPQYLLPRDEKRPAPVTEFTRCAFVTQGMSRADFAAFCQVTGIKLRGCTFNGAPIELMDN